MKHLYVFTIFYALVLNAEAKNITLDIPDRDIAIVENDVIDAEQWIRNAWAGKLAKCKDRIIKTELDRSIKEATDGGGAGDLVPLTESAIIDKAFARPDYKSRKQRETEILKEK